MSTIYDEPVCILLGGTGHRDAKHHSPTVCALVLPPAKRKSTIRSKIVAYITEARFRMREYLGLVARSLKRHGGAAIVAVHGG